MGFPKTVQAYCRALGQAEQPYYVMDRAGYSEENLKAMEQVRWLTRVPETLKQAKVLVAETQKGEMGPLEAGYWGKEVPSDYGEIRQRWLVIFSDAARQREEAGLVRKQAKELETAGVQWHKLMQTNFNCQADAEQALAKFNQKLHYHQAQATLQTHRWILSDFRIAIYTQQPIIYHTQST